MVIMGIGAGKSILFMLPASYSGGVLVIIIPLVLLRGDIKVRCDKAGIKCVEWDSQKLNNWASVVLVTLESAVSKGFRNFINRQRAIGRLVQIVVDKYYVILDSKLG